MTESLGSREKQQPGRGRGRNSASAVRSRRIPLINSGGKLTVHGEVEGHVLRWFNDDASRMEAARGAGWTPVDSGELAIGGMGTDGNSDVGSNLSVPSGTNPQGGARRMVLMKLPEEFAKEDRQTVRDRISSIEGAINGGTVDSGPGQYVPKDAISVRDG